MSTADMSWDDERNETLAYRIKDIPGKILPISLRTLYREIKAKRITPTRLHLIPRMELIRYLKDEVSLARRRAQRSGQ